MRGYCVSLILLMGWFDSRFQLTVQLPCVVSYVGVSTTYNNDLVEVTMPKQKNKNIIRFKGVN